MEAASIAGAHAAGHEDHHLGPPEANRSSRVEPQLLGMLRRLRAWTRRGAAVSVRWYVDARDDDMIDTAADFQSMSGLPIHILSSSASHASASAL